jgi:hypothetical protein
MVQECLLWQAGVELTDLPPGEPDMNCVRNMLSEVKNHAGKWLNLPTRNRDVL